MKVLKLFEIANRAAAPMALKNVARLLKMMWDRPVNKLMIAKCEAANWDAGDESLREFLWKFFSGCNSTFHVNEKTFGNVARVANLLGSNNGVISDKIAWHACATAPSLDNTGINRIAVNPEAVDPNNMPLDRDLTKNFFKRPANHKTHPDIDLSPLTAKHPGIEFQRNGPAAQRQLASAIHYTIYDEATNYSKADDIWRCELFFEGVILRRECDLTYWVSMGGSDFSFQALKLKSLSQGGCTLLTTFASDSAVILTCIYDTVHCFG